MHKTLSFIGGASLGAGLMYILDPDRGKRRRALIRIKSIRWSRKTRAMAGSTTRDLRNRMKGVTSPENVPELQGTGQCKQDARFAFFQSHWSPTARLFSALMGTAALLYGLRQRTVGAGTLAASGLGLLIRSAANREFARLLGLHDSMGRAR